MNLENKTSVLKSKTNRKMQTQINAKPAPQRFNARSAALLQHQRPQTNRQTDKYTRLFF